MMVGVSTISAMAFRYCCGDSAASRHQRNSIKSMASNLKHPFNLQIPDRRQNFIFTSFAQGFVCRLKNWTRKFKSSSPQLSPSMLLGKTGNEVKARSDKINCPVPCAARSSVTKSSGDAIGPCLRLIQLDMKRSTVMRESLSNDFSLFQCLLYYMCFFGSRFERVLDVLLQLVCSLLCVHVVFLDSWCFEAVKGTPSPILHKTL